jgi:uncharacterized membrane protein
MNQFFELLLYGILLVVVDSLYLSRISVPFGKMVEQIQKKPMKMKIGPAVIVYLALVGAWYFFIYREMKKRSFGENVGRAALLGLFIYSVYDFTNLALIDGYRLDLAIIDSVWGSTLFALTTALFSVIV